MQKPFSSRQRLIAFLNNCGFNRPHLSRWNWPDGKWPSSRDQLEEILHQLEQTSLRETVLLAMVQGFFRLELDHDRYRLRYEQGREGRSQLFSELLAAKGITEYEVVGIVGEGRDLAVYREYGMVEDCSGTVVTLTTVYSFWLDFVDGHFTLGDTRFYSDNGEEHSFWSETGELDANPDVKEAKRRLHLRRPAEPTRPDSQGRTWEIREEDVNQISW